MLSYIAEIYEVDFCDHVQAIRILEGITKDFPESRFAANAASKIKEFDKLSQTQNLTTTLGKSPQTPPSPETLPAAFQAYWIRFTSTEDTTATAQLIYE